MPQGQYSDTVMEHFTNPRNMGEIENAEALGGLPPAKQHCSVLAEEALKIAIEDYNKKKGSG